MKRKIRVKVLRNYDGLNIDVIDEVERIGRPSYTAYSEWDAKSGKYVGRFRRDNGLYRVTYKGKQYRTFGHPEVEGHCIAIPVEVEDELSGRSRGFVTFTTRGGKK